MGLADFLLGVVVVTCLGFGVGFGAMTDAGAVEILVARICFLVAAVTVGVAFVYWVRERKRSGASILVAAVATVAWISVGLPLQLKWLDSRVAAHLIPLPPPRRPEAPTPPKQEALAQSPPVEKKPPQPSPPWMTSDEIEAQRKLGRTPIIYSPEELIKMWVSHQNISIYENKWIKLDYPMDGVPFSQTSEKKEYYVVRMRTNSDRLIGISLIYAYFDPKKWGGRLLVLRTGDYIKAFCRYQNIQQSGPVPPYGVRADVMILYNCELL
jgi:hypothetical protein